MPTIQYVGRQAVQPAIKREPESARGRKHGITEATDISLTVPLSATEKGTLCYRKPSMTVEAARPRSWGIARLSFGMPKNVGGAAIALSFKPEDAPRLSDEFMAKIAFEDMI